MKNRKNLFLDIKRMKLHVKHWIKIILKNRVGKLGSENFFIPDKIIHKILPKNVLDDLELVRTNLELRKNVFGVRRARSFQRIKNQLEIGPADITTRSIVIWPTTSISSVPNSTHQFFLKRTNQQNSNSLDFVLQITNP